MTLSYSRPEVINNVTVLAVGLLICEQATSFTVYLGCNTESEKDDWMMKLQTFWKVNPQGIDRIISISSRLSL